MKKHLLLVISTPVPGRDEEYNRWYTEQHLRDVLAVDGFVAAERFKVVARPTELAIPGEYAAIYEMESDDPQATFDKLAEAAQNGGLPISDAMEPETISVTILTPIASMRPED